jgi:type VI secretion system protein ImpJ
LQQQLPVVRHQLGCSATHPAQLYAELLRLAGGLLVFSPDASPDFPVYQHEAIGACYAALLLRIQELLGIVVRERYTVIRLTQNRSVWDGRIDDSALLERGEFYLVATGDVPRQEFERLPGACKVAESGRVESLARTANPGLRLEPVPRPREPIPVRKDAHYFRLFSEGSLWEEVRKSGQIGLFVPRAPEGLTLELVALRDAHGGAGR